jgi:hypothetical protein
MPIRGIRLALFAAIALVLALPAHADQLRLVDSTLEMPFSENLTPVIPQTGPAVVSVSTSGAFTIPEDLFIGSSIATFFTGAGVSLVSPVALTVDSHQSIAVSAGGVGSGVALGQSVIGVLGGLINMVIPLSLAGSGTGSFSSGSLQLTAEYQPGWTTGVVQVTGVDVTSPNGASVTGTISLSGSDSRTAGFEGSMTLVSAVRVITNAAGTFPLFATLNLQFVPEPGSLLLAATALLFAALGWRRR